MVTQLYPHSARADEMWRFRMIRDLTFQIMEDHLVLIDLQTICDGVKLIGYFPAIVERLERAITNLEEQIAANQIRLDIYHNQTRVSG
jgi:hypothetical protein